MLQRDGMEMMVLAVEMVMMMIPMKSSWMTVMMVTISPSGREFPPADFCLSESFSLSVVFRFAAAAEYFCGVSPMLRVIERRYMQRDAVRCGPGPPHHA